MTADEWVFGLPRASLFAHGETWRGVRPELAERVLVAARVAGHHRPRRDAEDDPSWKQLIPYLVLRDGARVWLMRRTRAGTDARLHDRYTIGVGGHLVPGDVDVPGGMRREFDEELDAPWEPEFRPIGALNDDDDPVGRVHLGLVYEADARGRPVSIRETHKLEGRFVCLEEARAVREQMETWSRLVLDHIGAGGSGTLATAVG